jgi:hypothetical protein
LPPSEDNVPEIFTTSVPWQNLGFKYSAIIVANIETIRLVKTESHADQKKTPVINHVLLHFAWMPQQNGQSANFAADFVKHCEHTLTL